MAQPRVLRDMSAENHLRTPAVLRRERSLEDVLFLRVAYRVAADLIVFLHGGEQPARGNRRGETRCKQRDLSLPRDLQTTSNGPVEEENLLHLATQEAPSKPHARITVKGRVLLRGSDDRALFPWIEVPI